MSKNYRPYIYLETTTSMCPACLKTLEAKVVIKNGKVYLHKHCPTHGEMTHLLEDNADFYRKQRLYSKPGTVSKTQTKFSKGCPFDCGLCTEHEQHTCIALIEITKRCNLKCPVCYANADTGEFLSLEKIEKMLNFYQSSEFDEAELLQISGGEPTLHPNIIEIIQMAQQKNIKYVMLNTNGLRLSEDKNFVKELSQFKEGFEIYLQFDGFRPSTYEHFRGRNISDIKEKAIKNLQDYEIPLTLVATIANGINDSEIGEIIEYGINTSFVRGINFQPVTFFGRLPNVDIERRSTLTGILASIETQTKGMLKMSDFIPLPCHPEKVAFTYLYKNKNGFIPITRNIDATKYLPLIQNTFTFMPEDFVKEATKQTLGGNIGCNCLDFLKDLKAIVPKSYFLKSRKERAKYINESTFRISISSFVDTYNFEMKAMKKECVHVITPDLKKIPFSAYNMIHRKDYD